MNGQVPAPRTEPAVVAVRRLSHHLPLAAFLLMLMTVLVLDRALFRLTADHPLSSDAVVVLAGSQDDRLPVAVALAAQGPGTLVVSAGSGSMNSAARALCHEPGALHVICFMPSPPNTRGEAVEIGRLAAEHGWSRITVVTSVYHLLRAGLLIARCTQARVVMVPTQPSLSLHGWVTQVAHEVVGVAEATIRPG